MNAPLVLDRGSKPFLDCELHRGAVLVAANKPVPRFWTAREVKVLHDAYPQGGVMAAAALLPGRTVGSIYQRATKEGLRSPRQHKPFRERWSTSAHIDEAIRRAYQGKPYRGMLKDLAARVMRPEAWVRDRAVRLGVVLPRFKEAPWTAREIELVRERATQDLSTIRLALKREGFARTKTAIVVKLKRLHLSRLDEDDDRLSARDLAALMGVDAKTVTLWIGRGLLKASEKPGQAREDGRPLEWRITPAAVRRFIIDNVAVVDLRKVDKFWFVDLVAHARMPGASLLQAAE